jgi:ribokinase
LSFAVVGHVEWTEFARVARPPKPGEIIHASDAWQAPAGGGAVAAVQIAKLVGSCRLLTVLGDDELGHRVKAELESMDLVVVPAWRPEPQRRAFVLLDGGGERTITTIGERVAPLGEDSLPWDELSQASGAYFTAGDANALRAAARAGQVVATVRAGSVLAEAGVVLDALVRSADDVGEAYRSGELAPPPRAVISTRGAAGGTTETADGRVSEWPAAPLPGPRVDVHGAGDSFAGGLTVGLGLGWSLEEAIGLAARCGAACVTGRGPYGNQLATLDRVRARGP